MSEVVSKPMFQSIVLVCEDNIMNQKVIRQHLENVGINPIIAENGQMGVEMVQTYLSKGKEFDLILMDVYMPVMDGLKAADKIIAMGVKTPIIAMTANVVSEDIITCFKHGMVEYLAKPFLTADLWKCLTRFLKPVSMVSTRIGHKIVTSREIIDEAIGIERSAQDPILYENIKKDFLHFNKDTYDKLTEALSSNDMVLAHRISHSLKNAAALIGAMKLQGLALEVERILTKDSKKPGGNQLHELKDALDEVLGLLEQQFKEDEKEDSPGNGEFHKIKAEKLIEELIPLLESGDSEALDFLDKIKEVLSPLKEQTQLLTEEIYNYNFDEAHKIAVEVQSIISEL